MLINKPRVPDYLIAKMWADYQTMSMSALARKYDRCPASIRCAFKRRDLPLRPPKKMGAVDPVTRQFLPAPEPTEAEIDAAIAKLTRFTLPDELRLVWRRWSMKKRAGVLAKIRRHLPRPNYRPNKPFSKNVIPFDYTSKQAWKIADRENKGYPSRLWPVRLKLGSQGVIYKGKLWFWASEGNENGAYYGPLISKSLRPSLHHTIWQENFGPIPAGMTVIFKDGNKNNLHPKNMALRSRAQCAIENSPTVRLRDNPTDPKLIALNKRRMGAIIESRRKRSLTLTNMLLAQHNSGQISLVALKK